MYCIAGNTLPSKSKSIAFSQLEPCPHLSFIGEVIQAGSQYMMPLPPPLMICCTSSFHIGELSFLANFKSRNFSAYSAKEVFIAIRIFHCKRIGRFYYHYFFVCPHFNIPDYFADHFQGIEGTGRNPKPDFVSDDFYDENDDCWICPKKIKWVIEGSGYEVKQNNGKGNYLSSNDRQIRGYIDNLAVKHAADIATGNYNPSLNLMTTYDV